LRIHENQRERSESVANKESMKTHLKCAIGNVLYVGDLPKSLRSTDLEKMFS
jgi:hypothetical protein